MHLGRSLICAAALALAACGEEADPVPPSGATALARCTRTPVGTLADCTMLASSVPGTASWFLEALRTARFELGPNEGPPRESSMLLHITVNREDGPPAR